MTCASRSATRATCTAFSCHRTACGGMLVSSWSSLAAACGNGSPTCTEPPGNAQSPLFGAFARRTKRTSVSALRVVRKSAVDTAVLTRGGGGGGGCAWLPRIQWRGRAGAVRRACVRRWCRLWRTGGTKVVARRVVAMKFSWFCMICCVALRRS